MHRTRPHILQQRQLLAETTARLMATDGLTDYVMAKRKAARLLGCDETRNLPSNEEVDEALRAWRQIFQADTHPLLLYSLRDRARELMLRLAPFSPWLIGPVLSGSAGEHSAIDLLILSDDAKSVEFFLLGQGLDYRHVDCPYADGISMCWLHENVPVCLTVLPPAQAHRVPPDRVRLDALEQLLADEAG